MSCPERVREVSGQDNSQFSAYPRARVTGTHGENLRDDLARERQSPDWRLCETPANREIGVSGIQPLVSWSWMVCQVIQLQGIFAQDHARNFIRPGDGDLSVLEHAGQGDPQRLPAHIFCLRRRVRTENGVDYFV